MDVTTPWWIGLIGAVTVLLAVDVVVTRRQRTAPTARESARWVGFYSAAAVVFGLTVTVGFGGDIGGQFFAGWVTEYSLSVDNLFVFMVLLSRFSVPQHLQLRVLTIGIVLALLLRGALIAAGAAAIERFSWVFLIFGVFLLWTAWSLAREATHGGAEHPGTGTDGPTTTSTAGGTTTGGGPSARLRDDDGRGHDTGDAGRVVGLLTRVLPSTPEWHGTKLFARVNGRLLVTPMLMVMVAIGFTDVLFALDSIPAIFGLTREPYLVVAANAFALMGLRQLFFLVGNLLARLIYLNAGLSLVLAFIGVKLVLEALHANTLGFVNGGEPVSWAPEIPTLVSLGVVVGTLVITALASVVVTRRRLARAAVAESSGPRVPVRPDGGPGETSGR